MSTTADSRKYHKLRHVRRVVFITVRKDEISARTCPVRGHRASGGASAAKEPVHFEVRTSPSQSTRMRIFSSKKVDDLFLVVALTTQRPPTPLRLFHCQNKTNNSKDSDMVFFFVF